MMIDSKNGLVRSKIRLSFCIAGFVAGILHIYFTTHDHIVYGSSILLTLFMVFISPFIHSEIFIHFMRWKIKNKSKTLLIESLSKSKIIHYKFNEHIINEYGGTSLDKRKISHVLFELENGNKLAINLYFWNNGYSFLGESDVPNDVLIDGKSIKTISEHLITEDSLVYFIDTVILPKCLIMEKDKNELETNQKNILLIKEKEDKKKEIENILLNSKTMMVSKNPEPVIEVSQEEIEDDTELSEQNNELKKLMEMK